jgi:hypothetical protein
MDRLACKFGSSRGKFRKAPISARPCSPIPRGLHHSARRWPDSERAYVGLPRGRQQPGTGCISTPYARDKTLSGFGIPLSCPLGSSFPRLRWGFRRRKRLWRDKSARQVATQGW